MSSSVDPYWIPLGAGGHVVRLSGKVFEAGSARMRRRPRQDLYHSALIVELPEGRTVIEQAPVPDLHGKRDRGVVVEGPVGARLAGHLRLFRYEIRRWGGGEIPDLAIASRILELVPSVPALVWGRDERRTGDMWNSNSIVSWLLVNAGIDVRSIAPPAGGGVPGWRAGIAVASATRSPVTEG